MADLLNSESGSTQTSTDASSNEVQNQSALDTNTSGQSGTDTAGTNTDSKPENEGNNNSEGGDNPSDQDKDKKPEPADNPDNNAGKDDDKADVPDDEKPVTDWSKVKINFPKDFNVSEGSLESFGEAVVKNGLSPKQAQALVDWQIKEIQVQQQAMLEVGLEELQKAWGPKLEANQKASLGVVQRIDRMLGNNEFSKALQMSGAALHPGVVKGLHKISEMISEDSMGQGSGAGATEKEDAYQGIVNSLNEQMKRRGR